MIGEAAEAFCGGTLVEISSQRQILRLEEQRRQALLRHDVQALDHLLADDYAETTTNRELRTKAQNIAEAGSGDMKLDYLNFRDLKVRVYGTTAVVTGHIIRRGQFRGRQFSGQARYTRVYVKRQGEWRAVAHEGTRVD